MHRRSIVTLAAPVLLAGAAPGTGDLEAALRRFQALPGSPTYLVHAGPGGKVGRFGYRSALRQFIASGYKTFVLGQYLRDIEAGRLDVAEQLTVDDGVRNIGSPVLQTLTGTTTALTVLEAMIGHSDNMATDIASTKVGADRIRALIAKAGLPSISIPDTTRLFESYIFGAPLGTDIGWAGLLEVLANPPSSFRPALNDAITLAGNARDLVSWYEQALRGTFFREPETLRAFKRIQAMSVQIPEVAPPDTLIFAKGGEVGDLDGFNAKSLAGQMLVGAGVPVTFAFLVNWDTADGAFPAVQAAFFAAIADILGSLKRSLG